MPTVLCTLYVQLPSGGVTKRYALNPVECEGSMTHNFGIGVGPDLDLRTWNATESSSE